VRDARDDHREDLPVGRDVDAAGVDLVLGRDVRDDDAVNPRSPNARSNRPLALNRATAVAFPETPPTRIPPSGARPIPEILSSPPKTRPTTRP
jgi:hypothetical protein